MMRSCHKWREQWMKECLTKWVIRLDKKIHPFAESNLMYYLIESQMPGSAECFNCMSALKYISIKVHCQGWTLAVTTPSTTFCRKKKKMLHRKWCVFANNCMCFFGMNEKELGRQCFEWRKPPPETQTQQRSPRDMMMLDWQVWLKNGKTWSKMYWLNRFLEETLKPLISLPIWEDSPITGQTTEPLNICHLFPVFSFFLLEF